MSLSFFEPKRAVRKFCAIEARILPEGERIKEEGFTLTGMRRMDKHGSRMNNSHRAIAHRLKAILLAAAILPILWACSGSPMARPLEREDLFELDFGDFQTQITAQGISAPVMDLAMSQGIFTLLDGSGKKATRFTSFGDVLSIVAPPDSPWLESPTLVSSGDGDVLYVADRQSREATPVVDKFSGTSADWVVRKFSSDGTYRGFIGQEGSGGTPFPRISSLEVLQDSSLVVLSSSGRSWLINRFGRSDSLLSSLRISESSLPVPGSLTRGAPESRQIYADVEQIVPRLKGADYLIYLKMDYYGNQDAPRESEAGMAVSGPEVEFLGSWIFTVDGTSGKYLESEEIFSPGMRGEVPELIGTRGESFFLLSYLPPPGLRWELILADRSGGVQARYELKAPADALAAPVLKLSPEGQLYGLSLGDRKARVFWWNLGLKRR